MAHGFATRFVRVDNKGTVWDRKVKGFGNAGYVGRLKKRRRRKELAKQSRRRNR